MALFGWMRQRYCVPVCLLLALLGWRLYDVENAKVLSRPMEAPFNPYTPFIPIRQSTSRPEVKPGLVQTEGWNFQFDDDCPARNDSQWKFCDPPACAGLTPPVIHMQYPKLTRISNSPLTQTVEVVQEVLRFAWGPDPPSIDLYVRSSCMDGSEVMFMLETVYLFWPRSLGHVVVVLDFNDRGASEAIIPRQLYETHSVKVIYEHSPCMPGRIFNQYAYLNLFRYIDAEYVVTIDGDCAFHSPVTPDYIFDEDRKVILPTSFRFQQSFRWDEMQSFFTKRSHEPLGHAMVTQPVNFHVASTFNPYLKWIRSLHASCYESVLLDFVKWKDRDLQTFCWMCQLKTFIVSHSQVLRFYNVFNLDDLKTTAYMRYALHVPHDVSPDGNQYELAQRYIKEGLCRFLTSKILDECQGVFDGFLFHANFIYAFHDLMPSVPVAAKREMVRKYTRRFDLVLDAVLRLHGVSVA